jgi:gluconolactonase
MNLDPPSDLGLGELELLAGGGASEGPVWMPGGLLYFTRYRNGEVARYDAADGHISTIRTDTGEANGLTIDPSGRLIMCEGLNRRVTRVEPDGELTVLAESWAGKRLNRPNDVVCRSDGSVYFTDPGLKVDPAIREIDFSGVFRVSPTGQIEVATDECEYPNGLAFSPDETLLYVAITRRDLACIEEEERGEVCAHRKIRAFDVAPDGSLSNNRVFADMTSAAPGPPDGMKVDRDGRVYCAGANGIWVFGPDGEHIGVIEIPERARNLAFGGADMTTMYDTAGDSLYRLPTGVQGIGAVELLTDAEQHEHPWAAEHG